MRQGKEGNQQRGDKELGSMWTTGFNPTEDSKRCSIDHSYAAAPGRAEKAEC